MLLACLIIFIYSACIASFLGVCISRIPEGKSVMVGRSYCFNCNNQINIVHNIPIISYLLLGGKCKYCGYKYGVQNFLVEIGTAALSVPIFLRYGFSLEMMFFMLLFYTLVVIFFIDFNHMIIPDGTIMVIMLLGIGFTIYDVFINLNSVTPHIIGFFLISVPLFILILIVKDGMGIGDIKLFAVAGFFLGAKLILIAFLVSVILGGIVGAILLIFTKAEKRSQMPFGPFICIGLYFSMLFGNDFLNLLFG